MEILGGGRRSSPRTRASTISPALLLRMISAPQCSSPSSLSLPYDALTSLELNLSKSSMSREVTRTTVTLLVSDSIPRLAVRPQILKTSMITVRLGASPKQSNTFNMTFPRAFPCPRQEALLTHNPHSLAQTASTADRAHTSSPLEFR